MGELFKHAMLLQEEQREKEEIKKALNEAIVENEKNIYDSRLKFAEERARNKVKFMQLKDSLKENLLIEAFNDIFSRSIKNCNSNQRNMMKSLVSNYITENGYSEILYVLEDSDISLNRAIKKIVKETFDDIMDSPSVSENNPETWVYDTENTDKMIKLLDKNEDVDEVTDTIRLRVAAAEEEFINKVEQDKATSKEIIDKTIKRIDDASPENSGYSQEEYEDIKQESAIIAKRQLLSKAKTKNDTLYGKIVMRLSESVIKDCNLREQFVAENGRLNMGKIMDSSKVIYTFLESLSTLKLENVDEAYIEDIVNTI